MNAKPKFLFSDELIEDLQTLYKKRTSHKLTPEKAEIFLDSYARLGKLAVKVFGTQKENVGKHIKNKTEKVIITISDKPSILIERTQKGEIKAILLVKKIHATYHQNGHNHFFDFNSKKTWKKEKYEIALKITKKKGEKNILSYAERQSQLINCTSGPEISKIKDPVFFIGMSPKTYDWSEKYRKLKQVPIPADTKMVNIYLSGINKAGNSFIPVLSGSHPQVLLSLEN